MKKKDTLSRRGFLFGSAAAAAATTLTFSGRMGSFFRKAHAQAAEPASLLLVFLRGGYNALFPSADSFVAAGTFGVWMVLMAILGGKGTICCPIIGATVFHVFREFFWTYLFGWQRVALGLLIVVIVVFFPTGIVGWMRKRWPERFGRRIEGAAAE